MGPRPSLQSSQAVPGLVSKPLLWDPALGSLPGPVLLVFVAFLHETFQSVPSTCLPQRVSVCDRERDTQFRENFDHGEDLERPGERAMAEVEALCASVGTSKISKNDDGEEEWS